MLSDKRGREFEANVSDCVNVDRTPKLREQILAGEFHRLPDPAGAGRVTVEKTFFYADFGRKQFFLVLPRWDRHKWQEASQDLQGTLAHFPESVAPSEQRRVRLVFGLAELREKLLAYDAELNDHLIEVLKILLLYEHPFLLQNERLNLVLDRVATDAVEFVATYDHHRDRYRLGFRRGLVDDLFTREAELQEWIGALQAEVSLKGAHESLWVSMHRWTPTVWALTTLDQRARQIEAGTLPEKWIDSEECGLMLERLPRGSDLSAAAKQDLNVLRGWAKDRRRKKHPSESFKEELWQIYFGKSLKGKPAMLKPEL
ncbi:MAG: CpXC domain-containing protein, partial [Gemmatimonadales bacterium]